MKNGLTMILDKSVIFSHVVYSSITVIGIPPTLLNKIKKKKIKGYTKNLITYFVSMYLLPQVSQGNFGIAVKVATM